MLNLDDPAFKQCLTLLESKIDEEKFVGILLVKSLIQPTDTRALCRVYRSIGLEFIYRLLQSPTSNGEESISYYNLAMTLLSTFSALEYKDERNGVDVNVDNEEKEENILLSMSKNPLINDLVSLILKRCADDVNIENYNLLLESTQFLYSFVNVGGLTNNDTVKIILQQVNIQRIALIALQIHQKKNLEKHSELLTTFVDFIYLVVWKVPNLLTLLQQSQQQSPLDTTNDNQSQSTITSSIINSIQAYNQLNIVIGPVFQLLDPLSVIFRDRVDETKFSILLVFSVLLPLYISNDEINGNTQTQAIFNANKVWKFNLKSALYSIFSSKKLKEEHRDSSIILYSVLVDYLGKEFFNLQDSSCNSNKSITIKPIPTETLILLSLQLSRTEIHMILLNMQKETILSDTKCTLITSCYLIIENVISFLIGYYEDSSEGSKNGIEFSTDTLGKIQGIMVEVMTIIVNYIKQAAEEYPEVKPTYEMVSALKLLGIWMGEEITSVQKLLQLALSDILTYFLSHKEESGYFLCFLIPGISHYIESSECMEIFIQQQGPAKISQYMNYYLSPLIQYIKDPEIKTLSVINELRTYGATADTAVNIIIPRSCEILQMYFNVGTFAGNNQYTDRTSREIFIQLLTNVAEQAFALQKELDTNFWDHYLTYQYVVSHLLVLCLSILVHYEEKDIPENTLSKICLLVTQYYCSIEFPETSNHKITSLWSTIKDLYLNGLELVLQNIDRHKSLMSHLSFKRWPPTDFRLTQKQNNEYLHLDNQVLINVNRNIGNLIRKLFNNS
ncbi:hypothetical protein DLAC_07137 [Tieghemostelium lacteum]|uniref:Uncharacterized protein n=1 Tax=Tieghemostelium lacteum TaxID=361077 RepID=A0A151ZD81_TIELA|nr:hypothetical protein DLAC_07137 [Tieghemostelium lacteum]|eukprot:KYQ91900.1 hypothetical protein DLAC_07137 [Tieghemostelium lacteum]